jgi:hypothetical protein
VISLNDTYVFVEDLSDMVDHRIDDFIYIGRRRWDLSCFIFYGDPIYDMESSFRMKNDDMLLSNDPIIQQLVDDMVADSFHPLKDGLLQGTHDEFSVMP